MCEVGTPNETINMSGTQYVKHKGVLGIQLWDWRLPYHNPSPQKPFINPYLLEYSHLEDDILITGISSLSLLESERNGTLFCR